MRIYITGTSKKFEKKRIHRLIRNIIKFSLEEGLPVDKQQVKECLIYVYMGELAEGANVGAIDEPPCRVFDMEIANDSTLSQLVDYTSHECVHIWQQMRGDLFIPDTKIAYNIWKGKPYPWVECYSWEYFNSPWEQEAYSLSPYLYYKFLQKMKGDI
jgi:hypothetical protein